MTKKKVTASILFSDVQGYSKLLGDAEKMELLRFIWKQVELVMPPGTAFNAKTWGDGYVIFSRDPQDAAEIALKMRDVVRNNDWYHSRFQDGFALRIGLHLARIQRVTQSNGEVELAGKGIDTASRIELVAEPDTVYCSKSFHAKLKQQKSQNIKAVSLGKRPIANGYDELLLFQLFWIHEAAAQP